MDAVSPLFSCDLLVHFVPSDYSSVHVARKEEEEGGGIASSNQ